MRISVEKEKGVIDGASREVRNQLQRVLNTDTEVVGDRLKFTPTRNSLDYLAHSKQFEFDPACRVAWRHFYDKKASPTPTTDDFSFNSPPYPHQREWFYRIRDAECFALEWEMGLGKTKTILDIVAWCAAKGELNGLLVVTLKDVHRNWIEKEVPEHFAYSKYDSAWWDSNKADGGMGNVLNSVNFAIASVNFDVVHRKKGEAFCRKFLTSRKCALVIDESHNIKTPSSERTKALLRFRKLAERRYTLSGTPVTQGPLDLWAPYSFLDPRILGNMNFHQFKARYAVEREIQVPVSNADNNSSATRSVMTVVGYQNTEELKNRIDSYRSRLLKDDVLDLPEKVYRLRSFTMGESMRLAYKEMKEALLVELADGRTMTARLALTKLLRLQQIVCGYVVSDDDMANEDYLGEPIEGANERLNTLMSILEEVQGKAIIWASFRYSQRQIITKVKEVYGNDSVVTFTGETPASERSDNVRLFQQGTPRFMVASPQAGGTGITLTAARDVIYYNNSFRLDLRKQSEDRAHRIGQKGTVTYTDIEALGSVDRHILKALRSKQDIASEISGDHLSNWLRNA